jgi:hypothetical protein
MVSGSVLVLLVLSDRLTSGSASSVSASWRYGLVFFSGSSFGFSMVVSVCFDVSCCTLHVSLARFMRVGVLGGLFFGVSF